MSNKTERAKPRTRDEWARLVSSWKNSGKTAAEFSREQGLNVKSLYAWATTLQSGGVHREAKRHGGRSTPRLVPVAVGKWADATSEQEKEQSSWSLTLATGECLRVHRGLTESETAVLLTVLSRIERGQ